MYTRKLGEQQADIKLELIVDFSRLNQWNMLTESALGIIFGLIQTTVRYRQMEFYCYFLSNFR
jgi:hypothetical protein